MKLFFSRIVLHGARACRAFSHRRGFSLIEMLVVVALIAVTSTIAVVRFAQSGQRSQLRDAKRLVRVDIERAQSYAQTGATCCGDQLPEGYGVVFSPDTDVYTLYAELGGNQQYDASTDSIISTVDLSTTELLVRADIASSNSAGSISFSSCDPESVDTTCDVFFDSPTGTVYTNGSRDSDFTVTLTHVAQPLYETVTVNLVSAKIE